MENFVLYEELGRTKHSTVYKGRRRGTISYVAVICIDKSRRSRATNWVRCIHSLPHHPNIVKFKEWYETNRHLWLVIDLCSGGTLRTVLKADTKLPIETVKMFGQDIVRGLHFLHTTGGIAHGDLTPDRVYLDGSSNVLKISNLSLSQKQNEKLEDIFCQIDADCDLDSLLCKNMSYRPDDEPRFYSSFSGDMYSLGVLIYELIFGILPDKNTNVEQNLEGVLDPELADLLIRLLERDSSIRMQWRELLIHPFWQNCFSDLVELEDDGSTICASVTSDLDSIAASINVSTSEPRNNNKSSVPVTSSSEEDSSEDTIVSNSGDQKNSRGQLDSDTIEFESKNTNNSNNLFVQNDTTTDIPTPRRDQTKSADVYKKKRKEIIQRTNSKNEIKKASGSMTNSRNLVSRTGKPGFIDIEDLDLDSILRCQTPPEKAPILDNTKIWKFNLVNSRSKPDKNLHNSLRSSLGDVLTKAYGNISNETISEAVLKIITYFNQCSPNEKIIHYLLESLYVICKKLDDDPDSLAKLFPVLMRYLQFKNSPNKFETRIRAARVLAIISPKIKTDARFLDAVNFLINDLRMNWRDVKKKYNKMDLFYTKSVKQSEYLFIFVLK